MEPIMNQLDEIVIRRTITMSMDSKADQKLVRLRKKELKLQLG
jgi:hypothetical protein